MENIVIRIIKVGRDRMIFQDGKPLSSSYKMLLSSLYSELLTTSFQKLWQLFIDIFPQFKAAFKQMSFWILKSTLFWHRIPACKVLQRNWAAAKGREWKGLASLTYLTPKGHRSSKIPSPCRHTLSLDKLISHTFKLLKCITTLYCYHFIHTASASDRRTCPLSDISMG